MRTRQAGIHTTLYLLLPLLLLLLLLLQATGRPRTSCAPTKQAHSLRVYLLLLLLPLLQATGRPHVVRTSQAGILTTCVLDAAAAAGNWEAKNLMCTYGEAFKPLADASTSSGWQFINEGKRGAAKWGYISTTPGSVLKIVVNSMRSQGDAAAAEGDQQMNVMLAYLKSYEGMGMAKFE
jgi:hypothetical protein